MLLSLLVLWGYLFASEDWDLWRQKRLDSHKENKTSFLNAYFLASAPQGKSLYLIDDSNPKNIKWVSEKPKKFYAHAEHMGDQIRLSVKDQTLSYLSNTKDKRRQNFTLPSGIIAEIVFGHRTKKMWAYLYNPQQINDFTGFRYFDYNPDLKLRGAFKRTPEKVISYRTVQDEPAEVKKIGHISFVYQKNEIVLSAYSWQDHQKDRDQVAIIFVDSTAPKETYGGGRELAVNIDPTKDQQNVELDFNRTTNFYCAHSPFWHCPVGLQEKINQPIRAGEMLPVKKIVSQ